MFALQEDCRILCTKDTQNSLSDSALAIIKRVIHDMGLDGAFRQTKHGLSCKNGSEFIFRGLQHPDRIKSLDGVKYCWVEEAQNVTQEAWDILPPTIREEGSEIWVSFNPDMEDDPAYSMFVANERPDTERVLINYTDNKHFPDVLQREMEYDKRTDFEKYLHVWEGHCRTISDAQVFKGKFRVDTFTEPEDVDVFYYGADWGFANDPTAAVRCYIYDGRLWITHEAYGVGVDINDTPALFDPIPGIRDYYVTADSARPETISYMRKHGFPRMRPAKKGAGSVDDGVAFIRSFEEVVIHDRCKHTADEFKHYSYKIDPRTGDILPVLVDKKNHIIDALRYGLEAVMRKRRAATVNIGIAR